MADQGRDWRGYWNEVEPLASPHLDEALKQVGKTQMGVPVSADQLNMILRSIKNALDLIETDHVLDLGCGNGLVTERIASKVGRVLGLDVSQQLIEDAQRFRATDTLQFAVGDFTDPHLLSLWPGPLDAGKPWKWYAYEVIQHLAPAELTTFLTTVLHKVQEREDRDFPGLKFFMGSIPDRARIHSFYDTPERWAHYERNVADGAEQIGTWWEQKELQDLVKEAGFRCQILPQDPSLYTSHYRFHALLSLSGYGDQNDA